MTNIVPFTMKHVRGEGVVALRETTQLIQFKTVQAHAKAAIMVEQLASLTIDNNAFEENLLEVREYSETELIGWIISASRVSVIVNPDFYRACCFELAARYST